MSLKLRLDWQVCSCLGCPGLVIGFKQQPEHLRKLQKRLAASILGCGKNRVWHGPREGSVQRLSDPFRWFWLQRLSPDLLVLRLDPNETNELSMANSRFNIRRVCQAVVQQSASRVIVKWITGE